MEFMPNPRFGPNGASDFGSNHNLLVTNFSLKLKRNEKKTPNSEPQFDSDKLLN